jgi:ATP-dependent exoDNAse (exonuclease V) alpha subunit
VRNGDRGVVTDVDRARGSLTVCIADRELVLPAAYLARRTRGGDKVVQHGYAITAYVAHGLTCRTALVLAHDDADQEWAYTTMSRGTDRNQLYAVSETADERLVRTRLAAWRPEGSPERLAAAQPTGGARVGRAPPRPRTRRARART